MRTKMIILLVAGLLLAVVLCAPIVALPLAFAAAVIVAVCRVAVAVSDEQPLALAALVSFRAPPV